MESCIYEGRVWHRRTAPPQHAFGMPLFMMYLDLEELPRLFEGRWLWSARRPALARFRREDYLGPTSVPLDVAVRDRMEERTGHRPAGPIRLLTHLRYFGFVFNPVSLYYCFDPGGRRLEGVVAEVTNTPWRERHAYVLETGDEADAPLYRLENRKDFHVSPFLGMDATYRWLLRAPDERLDLQIESRGRMGRLFEASLQLRRREIDAFSLARCLAVYPWMTLQVVAGIYWQATRLRSKNAHWHPHPLRDTVCERPGPEVTS
jgi:DUF1365 family protein